MVVIAVYFRSSFAIMLCVDYNDDREFYRVKIMMQNSVVFLLKSGI